MGIWERRTFYMKARVGCKAFVSFPALQMSKRGDGRDCGMNLTIDGKLRRKETRERKRGRKGEKSCQKGNEKRRSELERVQWK